MSNSFAGSLISLQAWQHFMLPIRAGVHRPPVPLESLQDRRQTLESLGEAIIPKPAAHTTRLGISAEQLLAVC